ncbi:hypothetical protein KIN20_014141 [Parelaphostrongylus tenuis]|uniref:Uncharacterized protein n=1 Tax=Parelaphostrongylus tenuis TaxID=148309 RepID=A0AAD5QP75_PARTN|nr:hypothetical protein KIN20_014141 [Parelaphostrongylus tenuis]
MKVQLLKERPKDTSLMPSRPSTLFTEHFENANLTGIVPFRPINLAAALKRTEEPPPSPRSTEEMRLDTLYQVNDDFPDLILSPLRLDELIAALEKVVQPPRLLRKTFKNMLLTEGSANSVTASTVFE